MQPKIANIASHPAPAVVVLAIALALSAAASYWSLNQLAREARAKFETAVAEAKDGIERSIQANTDVLHGVRGLFGASESVSRVAFRRYVSSLNLEQRYPGIQVIGLNRRVPFEQKRDYEIAVRRDTSIDPNGYPNFAIKPPGDRPEYFVVDYFEPAAGNEEAFGLDVGGDAVRLAAVERARDSGKLAASGRITITRGDTQHVGFALRLPIYRNGMPQQTVEQRREAMAGLIAASYRMDVMMRKALSEQLLRQFHIRIHDAGFSNGPSSRDPPTAKNLLFDNGPLLNTGSAQPGPSLASDANASFSKTLTLDVGERRWDVYFSAREEFGSPSDRWLPFGVLFGGISITLLLFGLIRSLATVGSRAVTLAASITEDLRQSEAKLAKAQRQTQELIEALPNPVYFKSTDGRYLGVNRAWEKFFGVFRDRFIGKTVHDLYPNNPEIADWATAKDLDLWEHPGSQTYEASMTTPDGKLHDTVYYKATFTHTDGSVAGLIGTIVDITERKQAEALRTRLAAIVESSNDAMISRTVDGTILTWNKGAELLFGYTAAEMIGANTLMLLPPDRLVEAQHNRDYLQQGKALSGYETVRVTKDGRHVDVSVNSSPIRDAAGIVTSVASVFHDITARKRADAARGMLAAIVDGSNDAIVSRSLDLKVMSWNAAAERLFGYSAAETIGQDIYALIVPPDREAEAERTRAQLTQDCAVLDFETVRRTKDGRLIDVSLSQSSINDERGAMTGVALIFRDIRERKQAETALRDSEARYRSVIAAIAEGVVLRDQDAKIVACNASAERILGKTLDQMRGSMFYDSSWQAIREDGTAFPQAERPIHVALRTAQLQSNVVQGLRKPDDVVLWLSMNVQPLFDESGTTLTGVVSTLTDITGRKQAEKRQAMEHAVTRVLAEAETLADGIPRIIQTVCESLGWACGAHWRWDETAEVLRCAETWHIDAAEIADFIAIASKTINEAPAWRGEAPRTKTGGLVRRVWMDGAPLWFPDVTREPEFRRGLIAAKAGLHCAFGFPVMAGAQPLGVMEFYGRNIAKPDEALLQVVQAIGSQIGQFMARRQAEERIRHLANYDELTGLPNRTMFHERLHHALAQAQRHARPLAVLFIDLDYFKNINDTLGHEAGDRVLREVAERLRACLRDSDTVGRLGGDEFVVLLEGLPQPADVAAVAQKILDAAARPFILAAQEFHIGASIGISAFPEDGKDVLNLLKNADAAMYRAKEQGRNNYQFYSAPAQPR